MEGYIGEIRMFGGNFAPRDWEFCEGQLLTVSEHPALFSILGTNYGGDGRTSFALPDLRGRAAMHPGQLPGRPDHDLGDDGGNLLAANGTKKDTVRTTPYSVVNFIICIKGIFPSRS